MKYEYCAICKRRIDKTEAGRLYCEGHSMSEIARKMIEYRQLVLPIDNRI